MKPSALSALGARTTEPPISWLMKMTLDHPRLISLAAGFTDNESLPVRDTRVLLERILRSPKTGQPALQYGSTAGDPALRRLTAAHLQALDTEAKGRVAARFYAPERVLLTHGSQQLLYMITEALCDPGDLVLVEDPTYFVYLGIMQSHGLRARGIRLGEDGLDLVHLERTLQQLEDTGELPRLKVLYLVSYYQNPTGITTSYEKKAAALDLLRHYERAAGHPLYLVEDAAYRELRFAGDDVPSTLATGRPAERVIYVGTYSKPFATGVRMGFGFLPEPLLSVVSRIKGNHDFGTANLLQQLLGRALASGAYSRHLKVLRTRYAHKAQVMTKALEKHFPDGIEWLPPRGGMYVWAKLPGAVKSGLQSRLFKAALAQDVLYVPGELCYADDLTRSKPDTEMRISFGGATVADMRQGIARLGGVLRKALWRT